MYVCMCHGITDSQIRDAVEGIGIGNLSDLRATLGVGSQCGKCIRTAQEVIDSTIVSECLFKDVG